MAVLSTMLSTSARTADARPRPVRVLHVLPALAGGGMELATVRLIRGMGGGGGVAPGVTGATDNSPASPALSQGGHRSDSNAEDPTLTQTNQPASVHGLCILRSAESELVARCPSQARIWVFGDGSDLSSRLSCWWRLRHVIRQFRPDVVHARSTGVWPDAVLATRGLHSVKLLLSFHGKTHLLPPGLKRRTLNRWAAARADAVLTVSGEAAGYLQQEYAVRAEKLIVIRNGVDVTRFHPAVNDDEIARPRAELGLDPSARLVICTANFLPIKGLDILLRAWPTIRDEWPSSRLLLVGEGPLQSHLQNLAWNLGCRQSVLFAGGRDNVAELLRAADLFVLPSHYEACSNAILEALASGLPVMACDTGGNRELVTPSVTGWLVPPGSPQALAEGMLQALTDRSALRRIGQAAREHAVTTHPESTWLAAYDRLYATLAAARHRRPEAHPCVE